MVTLTRITGATFALNPDLIERVDRTPDTVITLVDGTKYLVQESLDEVVQLVIDYRARLLNAAGTFEPGGQGITRPGRLTAVPDVERDTLAGVDDAAEEDVDDYDEYDDGAARAPRAVEHVVPITPRTL